MEEAHRVGEDLQGEDEHDEYEHTTVSRPLLLSSIDFKGKVTEVV